MVSAGSADDDHDDTDGGRFRRSIAQRQGKLIELVEEREDAADDFRVLISGAASVSYETNEFSTHDLEQGERVGVPVALLILLALFGAVVAALIPIGLAIVAIVIALGIVAVIGPVLRSSCFS